LESYGGVKGEVSKALGQYVDAEEKYLKKKQEKMGDDINESDIIYEDAPIAKIVSNLIRGAAEKSASDIHIEIDQKEISVRYRIDGIMQKSLVLPKNIHRAVVARIKILSRIKIDERRKPQDGRFSGKFLGRKIDFRVSTFPTYYGEKVVMRLLEQDRGALLIEELGFTKENLEKVKKMLSNSYGMILVCGPTGSGKTSTLYSLLNEINKKNLNVVSLENPIELNIPGVSQSQVRPEIDYTFSEGLRSILRQDPDIIMVGEIRDKETASLAIEASLTGHLVLSTIHTNTAADVPQRLVDMGIEPYLIGPTLIAAIGQRLIRKIIPEAKKEIDMDIGTKKFIEDKIKGLPENIRKTFLENDKMYKAQSIKNDEDGMAGRIAVFEVLEIDNELKRIIVTDPSSISIFEAARKKGYITFKEDGIIKAFNGITTFEEVMKL
jgi:type IV pilus assembly protein PilB